MNRFALLPGIAGSIVLWGAAWTQTITVDPATTYQTIQGWEGTAQAGQFLGVDDTGIYDPFVIYRDELFDRAVEELGLNRVRLEIRSSAENPTDWWGQFYNGEIARELWRTNRYTIVNDNADPNVADLSGFQFSEVDDTIDTVVLPMKQRLEARGEELYVSLNYVDFQDTAYEHYQNPEEYAEFMLVAFAHFDSKYGFVPDAIEMILEPDNSGWTGTAIGNCIAATEARLTAAGYAPEFVAPSCTNMGNAVSYFDSMVAVAGVSGIIDELCYHRYSGVSQSNLQAIASRGATYGIRTAMLEHIGSGARDLFSDLLVGNNSAWAQFTIAFPGTDNNGGDYYEIDVTDPENPEIIFTTRAKYLRQVFPFVRRGDVRIDAASTDGDFTPVAFRNGDGDVTVAIQAEAEGTLTVEGLPAGRYAAQYTLGTSDSAQPVAEAVDVPAQDVSAGGSLVVTVPSSGLSNTYGVLTIYPDGGAAPVRDWKRFN